MKYTLKPQRHHFELLAFALLIVVAVLAVIVVARGPSNVTKPPVQTPQTAAAKIVAQAPISANLKAQDSVSCPPPPGEGVVGSCTPKPVQVFGTKLGPKLAPATVDPPVSIPDVSSWQGAVNWQAVKSWQQQHGFKPAGIFKIGEYITDPFAARNNYWLRTLGMWRAGYWYLRRTGVIHEAQQIIAEARALGLKIVFLDDEVPEAAGYDGPVTAYLHQAAPDLIIGEYASPGSYPGGTRSSNPAWIAAYGPLNPPAAPWGGPIKAYQCTDGVYGCVTYVPGIGRGDVSVDYGVTSLGGSTARPCGIFPDIKLRLPFGVVARECNTVHTFEDKGCVNPVVRTICKSSRFHISLLRDRIWFLVHHQFVNGHWVILATPRWSDPNRGQAFGLRFSRQSYLLQRTRA